MRTYQEINADVKEAIGVSDSEALLRYTDELTELGTSDAEALSHLALANAHRFRSDYRQALEHYQRALTLFNDIGNRKEVAAITGSLGSLFIYIGNYPSALESYRRAQDLYTELDDRNGVATIIGNIGVMYFDTGDYPMALEHFQKARDIAEELGDRIGFARATGNIGNVYGITSNYPAALECFISARDLHEELDDRSGLATVTGNIGNVYKNSGDYPAALEHYHRALDLYKELGIGIAVAHIMGSIVSVLLNENRIDEAVAILDKQESMIMDTPRARATHADNRAKVFELKEDYESAHEKYLEALDVAKVAGLRSQQAHYHKKLRDLAQHRNDLAGYVEHNNAYTNITEEVNGKDTATKLAMQAKQREIDFERKETEKQLAVLHSTLPKHIADRVARGETVNDHHENATVIFLDIVGFTTNSSDMESGDVTKLLACVFEHFDAACDQYSVTKIKTIGDSYMAVGFDDPVSSASLALAMNASEFSWPDGSPLQYRIGMHTGPVTAGVIGTQRMQYDVWGDTVNVASRMESSGEAGRIQVSEAFARSLSHNADTDAVDGVRLEDRGTIEIKGKGLMNTYWIEARSV